MTDHDKEELRELVKRAVKEAVTEETMFFTQTCINLTQRVGALEGRSDVNSIRARAQQTMIEKVTAPKSQFVMQLLTILYLVFSHK